MSYFTAKSDYGFVLGMSEFQRTYLQAYHELISFMDQNQMSFVPISALDKERQERILTLSDIYRTKRDYINHSLAKLDRIADRYEATDVTPYFLEATKTPDYGVARPAFFGREDYSIWNDGMQRLLGHIQVVKDEERKKLYNPANWIALIISWILFFPISVVKAFGVKTGTFWETLSEQLAKLIVYGGLVFAAYHWFGLSKAEVRQAIMKYVGLEQDPKKPEAKETNKPVDKSSPKPETSTNPPSSQKRQ